MVILIILLILLILIVIYLFFRIKRLEKQAITGTVNDNTVTLHLNNTPFNQLKIKN